MLRLFLIVTLMEKVLREVLENVMTTAILVSRCKYSLLKRSIGSNTFFVDYVLNFINKVLVGKFSNCFFTRIGSENIFTLIVFLILSLIFYPILFTKFYFYLFFEFFFVLIRYKKIVGKYWN